MNSIELNGHTLTYTTQGSPDAPLLLLLHGCLSHCGVWQKTMDVLSGDYYCVAIDHLGFGDSDKPVDGDYSIRAQAERALKFVEHLGYEEFTLIGHSMGGQISFYIASILAPERVKKLVSVDGVLTGALDLFTDYVIHPGLRANMLFPPLGAMWRRLSKYPRISYFLFKDWFHNTKSIPFDAWKIDRDMAYQPGCERSGFRAIQAMHELDLTDVLNKITAQTLVIFGAQDTTVPVKDGYVAKEHIPDCELVLIDECGHFPMYEKPDQYLEAVTEFLAR